ncbi:hypothetical protein [Devosia sp.]|uniref:hypothetical protein n=1 Tax=Devosia sp. TaxID=1871048 RepID=UPI002F0C33D1
MIRTAAIAVALAALATPSLATEWVNCSDAQGEASFDYLAGAMDVLAVVGLTITVGEQVWASDVAYGPGEPVAVGQAFGDEDAVRIDVMDQNLMSRVAELRLFKASEGDRVALGGTLRIPGHGAWAVSCTGP